jgi:hypothetical protein
MQCCSESFIFSSYFGVLVGKMYKTLHICTHEGVKLVFQSEGRAEIESAREPRTKQHIRVLEREICRMIRKVTQEETVICARRLILLGISNQWGLDGVDVDLVSDDMKYGVFGWKTLATLKPA